MKGFKNPEMEIVLFGINDVIVTSPTQADMPSGDNPAGGSN